MGLDFIGLTVTDKHMATICSPAWHCNSGETLVRENDPAEVLIPEFVLTRAWSRIPTKPERFYKLLPLLVVGQLAECLSFRRFDDVGNSFQRPARQDACTLLSRDRSNLRQWQSLDQPTACRKTGKRHKRGNHEKSSNHRDLLRYKSFLKDTFHPPLHRLPAGHREPYRN